MERKMNLLSLYHFFLQAKHLTSRKKLLNDGLKVHRIIMRHYVVKKKIFDAGILLVDKKELFQKRKCPLLYKLINYTVKIAAVVLLVVVSVTIYKYQELVKKIRGITNHTCSCRSKE